jgi:thiol-disulfide isomerase/thioredoxin
MTAMNSARVLWGVLGLVVLAVSAIGIYSSLRPSAETESAAGARPAPRALAFRIHDAPRPLPEIAFEDGEGRSRSLAQFTGKVMLLNVWATWCAPCREEMPALDGLQRKLGGPGFEVLALSIDSVGAPAVRRFYEEMGVRSLAVYIDSTTRASASLGAVGIPTTLLIDRQGREVGRHTGPAEWDGPQAVRVIEEFLQERKG